MREHATSTLCQPDDRKSCCACCGLLNLRDISRMNLSQFLSGENRRSGEKRSFETIINAVDDYATRDVTTHICPHQGFICRGRPGCLLHPLYASSPGRCNSLFGEAICDSFLCPAHSILNDEQKNIIIKLVDDWYYYTVAIIDPGSVVWFLALLSERYRNKLRGNNAIKKSVSIFLEIHSHYLQNNAGPVFFYSVPEYSLGNKNFSLLSGAAHLEPEKIEIREAVESSL
jgi:hypothetical protein